MTARKCLLMALALLIGVGLLLHFEQRGKEHRVSSSTRLLPGLAPEQVTRLSLVSPDGVSGFERDSNLPQAKPFWIASKPLGARTDQSAAAELLKQLQGLASVNTVPSSELEPDQNLYGLSPPEMLIALEGAFGKRVVSFGKTSSLTERRYVQLEGVPELYLVEDSVFQLLAAQVELLRPMHVLDAAVREIAALSITDGPYGSFAVRKAEAEAAWMVSIAEQTFEADTELIERELQKLLRTKAEKLIDPETYELALCGLVNPLAVMGIAVNQIQGPGPNSYSLRFGKGVRVATEKSDNQPGKAGVGFFIQVSGDTTIYQFDRAIFAAWLQHPNFLRPRKPFARIDSSKISELRYLFSKDTVRFTRLTTGAWEKSAAATADRLSIAQQALDKTFELLRSAEVLSYGELRTAQGEPADETKVRQTGLDGPGVKIEIVVSGIAKPFSIAFGKAIPAGSSQPDTSETAPRYVAISRPDGDATAIMSHELAKNLMRSMPKDERPK